MIIENILEAQKISQKLNSSRKEKTLNRIYTSYSISFELYKNNSELLIQLLDIILNSILNNIQEIYYFI